MKQLHDANVQTNLTMKHSFKGMFRHNHVHGKRKKYLQFFTNIGNRNPSQILHCACSLTHSFPGTNPASAPYTRKNLTQFPPASLIDGQRNHMHESCRRQSTNTDVMPWRKNLFCKTADSQILNCLMNKISSRMVCLIWNIVYETVRYWTVYGLWYLWIAPSPRFNAR